MNKKNATVGVGIQKGLIEKAVEWREYGIPSYSGHMATRVMKMA